MKKKKILLCWGTRPEAIKMAALAIRLKSSPNLRPVILLTGQHREMTGQVMKLFNLRADFDLKVMTPDQTLASLSERILSRMDRMFHQIKPDCVLVQGDTTTAFLTALSAFYKKIPVGHIEAGLRTDDKYQPFPEEMNRRLITPLAEFHFAPTRRAFQRLVREGVRPARIVETGNTGIDALLLMKEILARKKQPPLKLPKGKRFILVTAHRRESFGPPLENICRAIRAIAEKNPDIEIYYPVHLNPNVQKMVYKSLKNHPRIHLLSPLSYDKLVYMMSLSELILTDSGGIQEEAPTFHKPILVLRNVTERPEGVKAGFSRIVGQNSGRIFREAQRYLGNPGFAQTLREKKNPYGDGKAALRIIHFLEKNL